MPWYLVDTDNPMPYEWQTSEEKWKPYEDKWKVHEKARKPVPSRKKKQQYGGAGHKKKQEFRYEDEDGVYLHHVHVVDHVHPVYHTHEVVHRHHYPQYVHSPTHTHVGGNNNKRTIHDDWPTLDDSPFYQAQSSYNSGYEDNNFPFNHDYFQQRRQQPSYSYSYQQHPRGGGGIRPLI